jgi:ABC-type antimicrobial peptide transport system permease subunit
VFADLGDRLRSTPGISDVSITDRIPFYVGFPERVEFTLDGRSCAIEECPTAGSYRVGPGYFRTLDIPIERGREFDDRVSDADVVVISETMARQLSPSGDVLGRRIAFGQDGRRMEVIGVAADVLHRTLRDQPTPYVYFPLDDRMFEGNAMLVARTERDPQLLTATAREHLRAVDPRLPPTSMQTMAQRLDDRARRNEVNVSKFFLALGGLAVFLAAVGLTGTVSYSVGQRTREFGVRAAIGATPASLRRLVFRDGLGLALPGVAIGLLGAFVLLRIIGSALRGVDLVTPIPYLVVGLFQVSLTLGVCALPGRRASRTNPLAALRAE